MSRISTPTSRPPFTSLGQIRQLSRAGGLEREGQGGGELGAGVLSCYQSCDETHVCTHVTILVSVPMFLAWCCTHLCGMVLGVL
jgi:hypothetical protein